MLLTGDSLLDFTCHHPSSKCSRVFSQANSTPVSIDYRIILLIFLINGHVGVVSSGLVNDKVSLVELTCHIRMLFVYDHHVSQVNWNPSCIIDIVICEDMGDHLIECMAVQLRYIRSIDVHLVTYLKMIYLVCNVNLAYRVQYVDFKCWEQSVLQHTQNHPMGYPYLV